jgi:hypothetical protein
MRKQQTQAYMIEQPVNRHQNANRDCMHVVTVDKSVFQVWMQVDYTRMLWNSYNGFSKQ